jgi:hypothetical protein
MSDRALRETIRAIRSGVLTKDELREVRSALLELAHDARGPWSTWTLRPGEAYKTHVADLILDVTRMGYNPDTFAFTLLTRCGERSQPSSLRPATFPSCKECQNATSK